MNLKKSEDSNQRRLEALSRQADEFKQKRNQIRTDLLNIDNSSNTVVTNKKILFSDDDEPAVAIETKTNKSKKTNESISPKGVKKQKLIDSSDDDEDREAENAKTFQMLENKINLNEKKANQLLHFKTKYSNDDGRFKIDDRFVDGSDSSEVSSSESESESEDSGDDVTEKTPKRSKKIISDESLKKKLKKETQASLDILASITGKSARKPVDPNAEEKKGDKPVLAQKMIRYDPTKTEHKIFELLSDNEGFESEITKLKSQKKAKESKDVNKENEDVNKNVDLSKYTKIEPNLKELFQSSDVFKFKFDNIVETVPKNTEWDKPTKLLENKFQKQFKFDQSYQDSSDSDSDNEHGNFDIKNIKLEDKKPEAAISKNKSLTAIEVKNSYINNSNMKRQFLPQFEEDNQIKDALSYFCCVKNIEELRKEWKESREKMVEEYKKKHKRMLRIQKTKENEKVMTWRFKKKN